MMLPAYRVLLAALLLLPLSMGLCAVASGAHAAEAVTLESLGELLDADSVESLRRLTVSAVNLAPEEGQGMAVINDKILHPGEMFGMVRLLYLGQDTLVFAFNGKNYVLHPSKRRAAQGADALP